MRGFFAVAKQTFFNAFRSHIFQLLTLLLLICTVCIPLISSGDGTPSGYVRVALLYSLSAAGMVLLLSSIWVSCLMMTQDVENYQLHMVVTKPISRWTVFFAKYFAVAVMHWALLALSAVVVYLMLIYSLNAHKFPAEELEKLRNEVMAGRRVFRLEAMSDADIDRIARLRVEKRIRELAASGEKIDMDEAGRENTFRAMRQSVAAEKGQVRPGESREWIFSGLPVDRDGLVYLRYRVFVGKNDSRDQRPTGTRFVAKLHFPQRDAQDRELTQLPRVSGDYLIDAPPLVRSGETHELALGAKTLVGDDGKARITYTNLDPDNAEQYFQPSDGPFLLIRETGFFSNFLRTTAALAIAILVFSAVGCALGAYFSLPAAVFCSAAYLLFGIVFGISAAFESLSTLDRVFAALQKFMQIVIVPFYEFDLTGMTSRGELVEYGTLGKLFLIYFVLRGVPFLLLGAWGYSRRELGLVVRR